MKKLWITGGPFLLGVLLAFAMDIPKNGFYMKNMNTSIHLIFIVNLIICFIILYGNDIISDIVYACNLFFMGIVIYIMLFIMNGIMYYHAPIELFTFIYTYIYARHRQKNKQALIIMGMILIAALIEGILYYV